MSDFASGFNAPVYAPYHLDAPGRQPTARPTAGTTSQGTPTPVSREQHQAAFYAYENAYQQMGAAGYSPRQAAQIANEVRRATYIRYASDALIAKHPPDLTSERGRDIARLKNSVELGLIASDVYYDRSIEQMFPDSIRRLSDDEFTRAFGLSADRLVDADTGFFAAVYYDDINERYTLATRGTDELKDWTGANLPQGLDLHSDQHTQGIELARQLHATSHGKSMLLVGHSLGGSISSAQSLATGWPAVTFNAASVEAGTLNAHGLDAGVANTQINAYYVRGEVLSSAQDKLVLREDSMSPYDPLQSALGERRALTPVSVGRNPHGGQALEPGEPLGPMSTPPAIFALHRMPRVMESLLYELDSVISPARVR